MKKVLYLYSGSRSGKFEGQMGKDYPDTQFYGLNHLGDFGLEAEYKEPEEFLPFDSLRSLRVKYGGLLPPSSSKFFGTGFGFRLGHLLSFFGTFGYDVVFGSSILYMMIFKKFWKTRTKFVLLNIGLLRTLFANRGNHFKFALLRSLLRELDGIVCLSTFQKERLEEQFDFLKGKVFFVPLGVDTSFTKPVYEGRRGYVLSAGRDEGRDYGTVFKVARATPGVEFQIVCSRRNLEGLGPTPSNVKVFYDMPIGELYAKYREAEVLLQTTHDDDFEDGADCSGQTVLLDAMNSGLPVVATYKKYIADYAEAGREIVIVKNGDLDATKLALEELLASPEKRQSLARNARLRVERELTTKHMAEGLSGVFISLS